MCAMCGMSCTSRACRSVIVVEAQRSIVPISLCLGGTPFSGTEYKHTKSASGLEWGAELWVSPT